MKTPTSLENWTYNTGSYFTGHALNTLSLPDRIITWPDSYLKDEYVKRLL